MAKVYNFYNLTSGAILGDSVFGLCYSFLQQKLRLWASEAEWANPRGLRCLGDAEFPIQSSFQLSRTGHLPTQPSSHNNQLDLPLS